MFAVSIEALATRTLFPGSHRIRRSSKGKAQGNGPGKEGKIGTTSLNQLSSLSI